MSNNSGPAKVRVLSSGTPEWNPARRRGDLPNAEANAVQGAAGGGAAGGKDAGLTLPLGSGDVLQGQKGNANGSLLWMAGAILLFVIGSAIGGLFVTISVLFPGLL